MPKDVNMTKMTSDRVRGRGRLLSTVCGMTISAALALPAAAQPQSSGESGRVSSQDEIVVTAQKRTQGVLDVPLSITAIPEATLERQNIDSLVDYATRVANLTFDQAGTIGYRGDESITLRGVSGRTNYYIDETPAPITDVRLFDVERIEILRGPQGTLYGDAAMGGTVKIVTNKPSTESFSAGGASGYSFTKDGGQSYYGEGFVNIPLFEQLAIRVSGYYEEIGGYIDNIPAATGLGDQTGGFLPVDVSRQKDVNGGTRKGIRAALRYSPTETLDIDLSAWVQDIDLGARSLYDDATPLETSFGGSMVEQQDFELYNATLNWNSGPFGIISSTTYYDIQTFNSEDITVFLARGLFGLDPSIFTNSQQLNNSLPADAFAHETRFTFDDEIGGLPVFAIVGVFYNDQSTSRDQYWFDEQSIPDINSAIDPDGSMGFDFGLNFDGLGIQRGLWGFQMIPSQVKQLAFFSEVSVRPAEWLEVAGGLRYFEFDVEETRTVDGFLFGGFETASGKTSDSGLNPRFNIKADISEDFMIYSNIAKGFNIGTALGSVLPSICDAVLDREGLSDGPVDPESLWSYEAGGKGSLLGGRVTVDASVFYIDWTDIQESVSFADNECPESLVGNFGNAQLKGGEVAFTANLFTGFEFGGSFGYTDVERDTAAIGTQAAEQVGNNLLTTSFFWEYSGPVGDKLSAYFGGDHQYIQEGETDQPGTPHYHLTNMRAGLASDDGWEVALIARNIMNSQPALQTFAPGSIGNLLTQTGTLRPRTIGVEARVKFN